ncbi:MAG: hypothetical protein JJU07_16195 [Natronohydrobacter sp.]|nr:hypothetical protein [Natronohydrobacter sp.]
MDRQTKQAAADFWHVVQQGQSLFADMTLGHSKEAAQGAFEFLTQAGAIEANTGWTGTIYAPKHTTAHQRAAILKTLQTEEPSR